MIMLFDKKVKLIYLAYFKFFDEIYQKYHYVIDLRSPKKINGVDINEKRNFNNANRWEGV